MGQTLVQNYLHIIFSTRDREKTILPPYETELHKYIGGICKKKDCPPIKVGGYTDHIHILTRLSKNIALKYLLQEIKTGSSLWMKSQACHLKNFYWQEGYGAFSVNPRDVSKVVDYITNQHDHHKVKSFQEELVQFLINYEIEYNEKYLWG